jgi:tripartite-type tricarboxylate transporter receptor subunit TctC
MNIRSALAAAMLSFATVAGGAQAQAFPTKTVTLIVPAAPGGVTDRMARVLAPQLSAIWGQQVIVENKPGANNQIARFSTPSSATTRKAILRRSLVCSASTSRWWRTLRFQPTASRI